MIIRFFCCLFFLGIHVACLSQVKRQKTTYIAKDTATLWFQQYPPQQNANGISVLFVHGGGFTGGNPENQFPMGEGLSKLGYNVFVIKYRLYLKGKSFGCTTPTSEKLKAIRYAVEDAIDATKYLVANAKERGIDTAKLFIAGSSAGAETVLNLIFNPFITKGSASYHFFEKFRFAGAMSFAGAVIDMNTVRADNWVPLLLMHGTRDQLVPFGTAAHHYCSATEAGWLMLAGSKTIYDFAQKNKLPAILYTYAGNGHEVSNYMFRRFKEMDRFMRAAVAKENISGEVAGISN